MTNLLEHSREYFARYGGALGALVQGKHVCALSAVYMAGNEEQLDMPLSPDPDYLLYNLCCMCSICALRTVRRRSTRVYELLKHSREYFVRYGGAKGASVHGNRVCAIGAVGMACTEEFFQQQLSPSASFLASTAETTQVLAALNDKVCETYDYNNIADVNDQLGEEAVLHVFDLCIKDCETR